MRSNLLLISLLLLALLPRPSGAQASLSRYQNKNRLLLVFAPSATDPRWVRQNALLAQSRAELSERDLLRFDVLERGQSQVAPLGTRESARLRSRYRVRPGSFRVLLIGKDGHTAFGSPLPVRPADLTARIDRMPMRRDEMRRRGERAAP